jgi:hypothetical protein
MSLFEKAKPRAERLKMLIYGASGTGKSVVSLHFPKPAVIDTERGTEHYGEYFDFHRIQTVSPKKVNKAVDELLKDPAGFKTFVIDSFSNLYDSIIEKQVAKMRIKSGNPNYEIRPLDYKFIKSDVKILITKMLSLDMNIIVTAKSKPLYSTDKDEFMQVIGTTPEGPKDLPYHFDIVLELYTDEEGNHMAKMVKDRTNKLPHEFEFNYKSFTQFIGIEGLEREAVVFNQQQNLEQNESMGRSVDIEYKGKELKTAGVKADTLEKIEDAASGLDQKDLKKKLKADYMVTSVLDLKQDEAELLLSDLTTKTNNK